MATGDMEVLLEVNKFDVDRDVEMNLIQAHIDIQKRDFRGGSIPNEFDRIATVEAFKKLGEGVWTQLLLCAVSMLISQPLLVFFMSITN